MSARTFDEYEAMFGLSPDVLGGRTLDCASGAAAFVAEAAERGHHVTGCDPLYGLDRETITRTVRAGVERAKANVAADPSGYRWDLLSDARTHRRLRTIAASRFLNDLRSNPDRYVDGRLPHLPFADRSFDLVLSSYLLFTYAGPLSIDFHLAATLELLRVAGSEVRIFPLVGFYEPADDALDAVVEHLSCMEAVSVEILPVQYRFQKGADAMLKVTRSR